MGELTFFLGLRVKQKKDGIFISQDKYVAEILKKFGFSKVKTVSTPMETQKPLLEDEDNEEVDVHLYRSMIGSLMYFTSSRPDIMFAMCAYAIYQVNPKVSHLYAVKRNFRYLKGQPKLDLWYLKDSPFDLVAYTDSDYAGASLDRKSTTGASTNLWKPKALLKDEDGGRSGCSCKIPSQPTKGFKQYFMDSKEYLLAEQSWHRKSTTGVVQSLEENKYHRQCKKQTEVSNPPTKAEYVAASQFAAGTRALDQINYLDYVKTVNGEQQLQALVDRKKIIITEATVTLMGYEKLSQKLTFYKAFFSPQWKFLIHTIFQCLSAKTTAWNKFSSTVASAIICLATN
ncbi:hypothetical protein Tco_0204962 [Tanacetum coccineum]